MEQRTFNYSLKNIPVPSEQLYKKRLIEKVEDVTKSMRWKVHFFESGEKNPGKAHKSKFKSRKCPPQVKELESFENDLVDMVRNIKFRKITNPFQRQMYENMETIRTSNKSFIQADKTRHLYELDKKTHDKLLQENITKSYKKCSNNTYNEINSEAKQIATKLGIQDRTTTLAKKQAFIILKDHKENFMNTPKVG